jgi:magnesium chelatase family protein
MEPLRQALDKGLLSIRGLDRAMRVAWTVADLAGRDRPSVEDVTTAMGFRRMGAER